MWYQANSLKIKEIVFLRALFAVMSTRCSDKASDNFILFVAKEQELRDSEYGY